MTYRQDAWTAHTCGVESEMMARRFSRPTFVPLYARTDLVSSSRQAYALSLTVGSPRERPLPSCRRRRGQTPDRNGAWTERGIGNPPSHGTVFYHRTAEKTRRLPACVRTHASLGRGAGPPEVISGSDIANFIFARSWDDGLRQDYGTTDYETTDHETTDYGDTGNRGNGDEPTTDV